MCNGWRGTDTYSHKTFARDRLLDHIQSSRVDSLLGGLKPHLHQVEGVTGDNGANTTDTTADEGARLFRQRGSGWLNFFHGRHFGDLLGMRERDRRKQRKKEIGLSNVWWDEG
jgi:hypothetical protein